ncbi:MAG: 50S ribosomal protein L15 [Candidatus Omnitrophica bacterium]|nr:50S ribosomal protein L15 [Candidatus Omnitrophota bacterium]
MQLHELKAPRGAYKKKVIVGRGRGSGLGKTSGRGQKGQKSRSGRGILITLESGQVPLIRKLPKVGFRSHRPILYQVINLDDLNRFREGTVVDASKLKKEGLIKNVFKPFKVLGGGELKKSLTVHAYRFSKSASEKIEKAGGKTETVNPQIIKQQGTK